MNRDHMIEYLSRITRAPVDPGIPIHLSSAQQGAFVAWLRKNWPASDVALRVGPTVSVDELLERGTSTAALKLPEPHDKIPPSIASLTATVKGVGIDIACVDSIPLAEDYRTEQFFLDNFSTAEIVYCLGRPEPRLSFAGLWAAKEAIVKACHIDESETASRSLSEIEVSHDARGRPFCKQGSISISHDGAIAVAVCIALSESSHSLPSRVSVPGDIVAHKSEPVQRRSVRLMFALAMSICVNAVLALALYRR